MKNKLIAILSFLSYTSLFSQVEPIPTVGTDKNWASSISYDLSGTTISKGVSYFDYLGKATQQQNWDKLTNRVWASEVKYDYFGRPALQTLSAPINNTANFAYRGDFVRSNNSPIEVHQYDLPSTLFNPPTISNDVNTLGWYYSSLNTLDPYQDVTAYPYTRKIYSELNPGEVKAVLGGNKINGNWLQSYSFNMAMEKPVSTNEAFYATLQDSKIIKTVSRDVHGVETIMFTDTDGNTLGGARSGEGVTRNVYSEILDKGFVDIHIPQGCGGIISFLNLTAGHQIRVYDLITETDITATLSPSTISSTNSNITFQPGFYRIEDVKKHYLNTLTPTFTPTPIRINYKVNYYDLSKNEYDLVGRLIKSTQPLNVLTTNELSSTFEYNSFGQLLKTESPDEGMASFKYRQDGQIRFSQNAEQAKKNAFSYTNYDELGRPVESGVYTGTEIYFDYFPAYNGEPLVENIVDMLDGLPIDGRSEQNFTVYDLPDPELTNQLILCAIPSPEFKQNFVAGNVSYTYTQNPTTSKTWYSYDVFGRVQFVVQDIEGLSCLKTLQYQYDPANGQILKVAYQKYTAGETFIHKYVYNDSGQLITVSTSADDITFTQQASYKYNESGALIRTELADNLQGIDYVYNLSGQLKAINHPSLAATNDPGNDGANGFAADIFGIALDYYNGDYTRTNAPKPLTVSTSQATDQYNGNIKATRWNTQVPSANQNAYTYQYNKNNWLTQATFGSATNAGIFTPNANSDYQEGAITYDANGNITALKRNGYTNGAGNNKMDNFQYKYNNLTKPNQLSYIKDTGDNPVTTRYNDIKDQEEILSFGTGNGLGTSERQPNYLYNDLGQMYYNVQDNIGYQYNTSGLVTKITTNTTSNSLENDYITLYYNEYSDPNDKLDFKKWNLNPNQISITQPFNIVCADDGAYPNYRFSLRMLGTQTVRSKVRVLPNTFTKIDLDVIVDKFLFKEVRIDREITQPQSLATDIIPTVKVRLKKADGTIVPGSERIISNRAAEYCGQLFDEHINIDYTSGAEEFITLEIETLKQGANVNTYLQRIFIDNLQVQAAQKTKVAFYYNDRGHRVRKESYPSKNITTTTYYIRDVAGNALAVQTHSQGTTIRVAPQEENTVFGASRIGVFKRDDSLPEKGYTLYELTDHLGNVRAVIRKTPLGLLSLTGKSDYYPFGMPMPDKTITDGNYRYNFQGQEKDGETGMEAFELRLWDGRIGRWLTVDPYGQYDSPYVGMGNNPGNGIEIDGGIFVMGVGWTAQQFKNWKSRMRNYLGADIFDTMERSEVPIVVNLHNGSLLVNSQDNTILEGNTKTSYENTDVFFTIKNLDILKVSNNYHLMKTSTFQISPNGIKRTLSRNVDYYGLLDTFKKNNVVVTSFDVTVNQNASFSTFGDELGHVYYSLNNPAEAFLWSVIESLIPKNAYYLNEHGAAHQLGNPSGIQADSFQLKIYKVIGDRVINTNDY